MGRARIHSCIGAKTTATEFEREREREPNRHLKKRGFKKVANRDTTDRRFKLKRGQPREQQQRHSGTLTTNALDSQRRFEKKGKAIDKRDRARSLRTKQRRFKRGAGENGGRASAPFLAAPPVKVRFLTQPSCEQKKRVERESGRH